jgi:hypothetical protein
MCMIKILIGLFLINIYCSAAIVVPPEPIWWHEKVCREPSQRSSDAPFLTSDTLRAFCTFIFDETRIPLDTDAIHDGDTIYIIAPHLEYFFTHAHPHIKARYLLVSHFGDHTIPGPFVDYLKSDRLAYWIGMNVGLPEHPKMVPIPIGLAPKNIVRATLLPFHKMLAAAPLKKQHLLYMNHNDGTNPEARVKIRKLFQDKSYCFAPKKKALSKYLKQMAASKFVVSPPGAGFDCYRTWEALLVGSYPLVERSPISSLYEGLPVVIVDDWNAIDEKFLNQKYKELSSKTFNREKLFADYWLARIKSYQEKVRNAQ